MKFLNFFLSFMLCSLILISIETKAQSSLEKTLKDLTGTSAQKYVAPITSSFGANLNSGWVHKAPSTKVFGVDFELGFVFMGTFFSDDNKTFNTAGTFRFTRAQAENLVPSDITGSARTAAVNDIISRDFAVNITGPTIVGKNTDTVKIVFPEQSVANGSVNVPKKDISTGVTGYLEELPLLPLMAPQLTIGTFYGTMLAFRYLPSIEINKDLGSFEFFGFGLQHNPGMWIPTPLPLDVSVGFFTQTMKIGKVFESTATTFGAWASKTFAVFTPYVGLAFESSSIKVGYDVVYDTPGGGTTSDRISFTLDGDNSFRTTLGFTLKLAVFSLSADYSLSTYNTFSTGLNIAF